MLLLIYGLFFSYFVFLRWAVKEIKPHVISSNDKGINSFALKKKTNPHFHIFIFNFCTCVCISVIFQPHVAIFLCSGGFLFFFFFFFDCGLCEA